MRLAENETSIELPETQNMNRSRKPPREQQAYEPLLHNEVDSETDDDQQSDDSRTETEDDEHPFSWFAYFVFMLLGVAMLWAWNMFLAAVPYFQRRFAKNEWILNHFQAAETSSATVMNLVAMLVLGLLQKNASYPKRILLSLIINIVLFTILALSTFTKTSAELYFGFLILVSLVSSLSTALIQNGIFAFLVGFGRKEYIQANMTGQAVAGVLPPLVQIISIAAVPAKNRNSDQSAQTPKSAFVYFLTATGVSTAALVAFLSLLRRKARDSAIEAARKADMNDIPDNRSTATGDVRESVPLSRLFLKIPYLSLAIIITFGVTMLFPVFTSLITSVNGMDSAIFIPLAFLMWNIGDLLGRLMTSIPQLLLTHHPFALFCLSMSRLLFIPLYFLCNIKGRGGTISSDFFYLVIVQLLFGLTNGYLGSSCMMGAGDWVAPDEREAVGGFMAMNLVTGLTIGSLLSFTLGNI